MSKGRRSAEWSRTSSLMALLANVNSSGKRWKPSDFDPTKKRDAKKADVKLPPKESIDILLKVFGVSNSR
jgi:hypothetical protein